MPFGIPRRSGQASGRKRAGALLRLRRCHHHHARCRHAFRLRCRAGAFRSIGGTGSTAAPCLRPCCRSSGRSTGVCELAFSATVSRARNDERCATRACRSASACSSNAIGAGGHAATRPRRSAPDAGVHRAGGQRERAPSGTDTPDARIACGFRRARTERRTELSAYRSASGRAGAPGSTIHAARATGGSCRCATGRFAAGGSGCAIRAARSGRSLDGTGAVRASRGTRAPCHPALRRTRGQTDARGLVRVGRNLGTGFASSVATDSRRAVRGRIGTEADSGDAHFGGADTGPRNADAARWCGGLAEHDTRARADQSVPRERPEREGEAACARTRVRHRDVLPAEA